MRLEEIIMMSQPKVNSARSLSSKTQLNFRVQGLYALEKCLSEMYNNASKILTNKSQGWSSFGRSGNHSEQVVAKRIT